MIHRMSERATLRERRKRIASMPRGGEGGGGGGGGGDYSYGQQTRPFSAAQRVPLVYGNPDKVKL